MTTIRTLILTCTAALSLTVVAHATAHGTTFRTATPADGARVTTETTTVRATYSGPVTPIDATLEAPDGSRTDIDATASDAVVELPVTFTTTGRHVLRWRIPQSDGHLIDYRHTLVSAAPSLDAEARRIADITAIWAGVLRLLR